MDTSGWPGGAWRPGPDRVADARYLPRAHRHAIAAVRLHWRNRHLGEVATSGVKVNDADNLRHRVFYRILAKAGLRRIRFHDLRHTFAGLLLPHFDRV